MTHVLLVGREVALLEGLAQSLAALGHEPAVATSLAEARDLAAARAATRPRRQSVAREQRGRRAAGDPARGGWRAPPLPRRGGPAGPAAPRTAALRARRPHAAARAASARGAGAVARRAGARHGANAPPHAARHARLGGPQELSGPGTVDIESGALLLAPARARTLSIEVGQTVPRGDFQQIAATLILC